MLKVLLAYRCPDEGFDDPRFAALPSGLPWLAAAVRRAGAEPLVANFSRLSWKDVERFLGDFRPDVVGVSAWPEGRREAARLLRVSRRAAPEAVLLAGGPLVDESGVQLLSRWREADALFRGEGETALEQACVGLAAGGREGLAGVPGLLRRDAPGRPPPPPPRDLDGLAPPDPELPLAGIDPERDLRWVVASRERQGGTVPPALRGETAVTRELVGRRKRFGLVDFSILGPGLLADRGRLPALAGALRSAKAGVRWEIAVELEDLAPRGESPGDRELLRHGLLDAAAAGCRRVRLSLRSDEVPLALRRQALAAASETLRSAGLLPALTLRVGDPERAAGEEIDQLRALVRALRPVDCELESRHVAEATREAASAEDDAEGEGRAPAEEARLRLERVAEALEPTLRDVRRSSRPGPRELQARRVRGGGGVWLDLDWGDYRAAGGDFAEAARHYEEAARSEPWSAHPWLRLARLHARRGAAAESQALREVLHRVPEHRGARERLDELREEGPRGRRSRHRRAPRRGPEA